MCSQVVVCDLAGLDKSRRSSTEGGITATWLQYPDSEGTGLDRLLLLLRVVQCSDNVDHELCVLRRVHALALAFRQGQGRRAGCVLHGHRWWCVRACDDVHCICVCVRACACVFFF